MKFICLKSDLQEAVSVCQRAVGIRSSMKVLEGILIETAKDEIIMTAYDTQICIKVNCMSSVMAPGSFVIEAKLFSEVIKKLSDGDVTIEKIQDGLILVKTLESNFKLKVMEEQDFPLLPEIKEDSSQLKVLQKKFKSLINMTLFSVSTDSTRPNLNGALLECKEDRLSMVGIDGFRMALCSEDKDENESWPAFKVVIHWKSLKELHSILKDKDQEMLDIRVDSEHVLFVFNNIKMYANIVKTEYMDHTKILPRTHKSLMKINTKLLLAAFERASLMILMEDNRFPVNLSSSDDKAIKMSINTVRGSFDETIEADLQGDLIKSDFNPKMFMEVLRVLEDEYINVEFSGPVGPCVIRPQEGEKYAYLLLPLRS